MPAKAAIADRPSTIKAKYSDEWKLKATFDRKGAKPNKSIAPNVPPINELIEAVEKDSNKIHEAADVFYHLIMYLEANNIKIEDVMRELDKRKK